MKEHRATVDTLPAPDGTRWYRLLMWALLIILLGCSQAGLTETHRPTAQAVATAHPLATQAGLEILALGGNAFDAAVAVSAALAVVEPTGSGLGGGGFWLLHRASDNLQVMIDGREQAPLAARHDMYLDQQGAVDPGLSLDGPLAAAIPGEPAALAHIAKHYGRLSLATSLTPAIRLAREGFPVNEHYRRLAGFRLPALRQSPAAAKIFLHNNEVPELGYLLRQQDLAHTLEALAAEGSDGFYRGPVANKLVNGMRAQGGIWSMADLAQYTVRERTPIRGSYHGMQIISAAPPSSGGIALVSMLNMLEQFDLDAMDSVGRKHVIIEAMRRAYRDRAEYLGDPDFTTIPLQRLLDKHYAAGLLTTLQAGRATPSQHLRGAAQDNQGSDTTHFSVLDQDGNRVAATLSINYPFGSAYVVPGTGVLLNDEMDDFSSKPNTPNAYGLIGGHANAIAPGKRPLSSMTPTFLEMDDRIAILGTPGGSRIITMVLLGALDFAAGNMPASWVSAPRYHHQFEPDSVSHEADAFTAAEIIALTAMGHTLKKRNHPYGNMQAILWDKKNNTVSAASDPRGMGAAEVRQSAK